MVLILEFHRHCHHIKMGSIADKMIAANQQRDVYTVFVVIPERYINVMYLDKGRVNNIHLFILLAFPHIEMVQLNPSNAEATFVQSTRTQSFLKTI